MIARTRMTAKEGRSLLMIAVLTLVTPAAASAQIDEMTGRRVRLQLQAGTTLVGHLATAGPSTLVLRLHDGSEREIPRSSLHSMDWERTRQARAKGLALGALAGGTLFGIAAAIEYEPCEGWCILEPADRAQAFTWGFVFGATAGAIVGGIIGSRRTSTSWEPVVLPTLSGPDPGLDVGIRWTPISLGGARDQEW